MAESHPRPHRTQQAVEKNFAAQTRTMAESHFRPQKNPSIGSTRPKQYRGDTRTMAESHYRPNRAQAVEEDVAAQPLSMDEKESVDERMDAPREMAQDEDETPAVVSEAESEELPGKTLTTAETISPVQVKEAGTSVTLSKMILVAGGKDHRRFCAGLIDSEMLGKASTQVKRARTNGDRSKLR